MMPTAIVLTSVTGKSNAFEVFTDILGRRQSEYCRREEAPLLISSSDLPCAYVKTVRLPDTDQDWALRR